MHPGPSHVLEYLPGKTTRHNRGTFPFTSKDGRDENFEEEDLDKELDEPEVIVLLAGGPQDAEPPLHPPRHERGHHLRQGRTRGRS